MARLYLIRSIGPWFILTAKPPQKTGITTVTFPPLTQAQTGRYRVVDGRLEPVPDKTTSYNAWTVPPDVAPRLQALWDRYHERLREMFAAHDAYVKACRELLPSLLPVVFPPPEDPS